MGIFFLMSVCPFSNYSELKLQTAKYALIMPFGGAVAQLGALSPAVRLTTSVIVGPTYDAETLAKVIHEERLVLIKDALILQSQIL